MNQNETNARNTQNAAAFRVMVVITHDDTDGDLCPIMADEVIYNNVCASRKEAIRQAQRRFARQPINGFVYQVWATVRPVTITPTGQATGKRIYNLFKTN